MVTGAIFLEREFQERNKFRGKAILACFRLIFLFNLMAISNILSNSLKERGAIFEIIYVKHLNWLGDYL